jgi:hypothetical protein
MSFSWSIASIEAGAYGLGISRTHLKNVFWPPAFIGGIGASFKILDIQQYASGFDPQRF